MSRVATTAPILLGSIWMLAYLLFMALITAV